MKRHLMTIITVLVLALVPAFFSYGMATAASGCGTSTDAQGQVLEGIGQTGSNCDESGVRNAIKTIVEIISIIAGSVAIIMVIYSGFKYITSAGDATKVGAAKNSLIYALIGVVIVVLAQFMVRFVITQSNAVANNLCSTNTKIKANDPKCKS